ncbi:MAG TPA: HEAT repeat domain-containing protein [Lacunisphaera sp.]|jgi:hypothetical protein|nr:HEAT repeat domain-containing protein [Lacunisphaera sp.]
MKKALSVILAAGVIVVAALLVWRRASAPSIPAAVRSSTAPRAGSAPPRGDKPPLAGGLGGGQDSGEVSAFAAATIARDQERFSINRVVEKLRKAVDGRERWLALSELRDPRFKRDDAIRVLQSALTDPDLKVRINAADLLFSLGSAAGRETLLQILRAAPDAQGEAAPELLHAADVLDRNLQAIPADLLLGLQKAFGNRWVAGIMAIQGNPQFLPYVEAAAREETIAGTLRNLGLLGSVDGYAFAKETYESTTDMRTRVAAAWAMFALAGDRAALNFVTAVAAQKSGGENGDQPADPYVIQEAWRELYVTNDPAVRELLSEAATSGDASALASLFYVQADYEFVDRFVRDYLQDPKAYPKADPALIGRIAAARNTPDLSTLASASSEVFRQFYYEPARGVPVESWIGHYLGDLPLRTGARPPKN